MKPWVLFVVILFSSALLFPINFVFAASERIVVGAGDSESLRFYLDDGDRIQFWISVSGGSNDDVDFFLRNPNGGLINQGRIYASFNDEITASQSGNYQFEFENDFSLISTKYVNFDYEIIKKPIFVPTSSSTSGGFIAGVEWMILVVIIIAIIIPIAVWKSRKKKKDVPEKSLLRDKINETKLQNENALKILKERLAKGEITKTEYDKLKKEFE